MRSLVRNVLLAGTVCALPGCTMLPARPSWMDAQFIEEMQNSEDYASFITARYADMSGDPVEAAQFYRRSFERSPNDPSALELATLATLVAGEAEQGIALAVNADPQVAAASPTAQFALGIEEIATNKNSRALARFRNADIGQINQDVQGFLVAWLTAEKDPAGALSLVEQQYPRRVLAGELLCLKGMILLSGGKDAEALTAFDQAARLPLGAPGYLAVLRARIMAANGDAAGARKLIETFTEENGATTESDYVLSLISSGKPVERPKLTVRQGAAVATYMSTAGRVARYNSDLAVMRYLLALRLDPDLAPARLALSDSLNERGRTEEAIAQLKMIAPTSPWSAEARMKEAWGLNSLDRPAEALASADAALAASRRRDILVGAADLYRINENNTRAEALYSEIIRNDMVAGAQAGSQDWRALFMRANVREAAGNWKDAEADLVAAIAIEPDRPELQNFLGYSWVKRGTRVQDGLALIRKAVAARPDQGYIVDSLGWANFVIGEYAEAVDNLERAAELSPSDPEIIDHLGDAYWRTGRPQDAQFEWRRALQLKPDARREADLHAKLDKGLAPLPTANLAAASGSPAKAAQ